MDEEREISQDESVQEIVVEENHNDLEQNDDNDKKKNSKKKKILIIIIGILLFVVIILIVLGLFILPKKRENTKIDYKQVLQDYGKIFEENLFLDGKLLTYEEVAKMIVFDYQVSCLEHEVYQDGTVYLNNCSINGKKVSSSYGKKVVLEEKKPGAIKVYVEKGTNKATLTAPSDIDLYDVYDFNIDERYSSLEMMCETCDYVFYLNNKNLGQMINYKTGEKALQGVDYDSILPIIYKNVVDETYVAVRQRMDEDGVNKHVVRNWGVYNIKTGSQTVPFSISHIYNIGHGEKKILFNIDAIYDGLILGLVSPNETLINYRTGRSVLPDAIRTIQIDGDYIFASADYNKTYLIYDFSGKRYFDDFTIYSFPSDGYMYVQNKEGNVLLMNIAGEISYDFGKYTIEDVLRFSLDDNRISLKVYTHKDVDNQSSSCVQFDYYIDIGKGVSGLVDCEFMINPIEIN